MSATIDSATRNPAALAFSMPPATLPAGHVATPGHVATWPGVATWPAGSVAGGIENANAAGLRVAESIVADMTIFAPMWCAAFLTTMAVLAAKDGHEEEEGKEEDGVRGDAPPTRRAEVRSIHRSPYDRVGEVNADP